MRTESTEKKPRSTKRKSDVVETNAGIVANDKEDSQEVEADLGADFEEKFSRVKKQASCKVEAKVKVCWPR